MSRTFVSASQQSLVYAGLPVSSFPITMCAWARGTSGAQQDIVTFGANTSNSELMLQTSGAVFHAYAYDGAVLVDSPISGFTANVWHHVCGVYASSSSTQSYLDGAAGTFSGAGASPILAPGKFTVGGLNLNGSPALWYDGDVAEVAVWSVALTAIEVAILAAGISPLLVRPDALVFYAPLFGGSPEPDLVGRRNLTLVNAPAVGPHPRLFALGRGMVAQTTGLPGAALASTLSFAVSATATLTAPLASTASFGVSATAALSVQAALAASASIAVSSAADLTRTPAALAASASFAFTATQAGSFGVDQSQLLDTGGGEVRLRKNTTDEIVAQSIVAGASGSLTQIDLKLNKFNSPSGNIWCELWSWSGTAPVSLLATSATVAASSVPAGGGTAVIGFTFATPAQLTAGTAYALLVQSDVALNTSTHIGLAGQANTYASGVVYYWNSGTTTWNADGSNFDLWFKTYVSDPSSPTLSVGAAHLTAAAALGVATTTDLRTGTFAAAAGLRLSAAAALTTTPALSASASFGVSTTAFMQNAPADLAATATVSLSAAAALLAGARLAGATSLGVSTSVGFATPGTGRMFAVF